jgi:hypothetical protein
VITDLQNNTRLMVAALRQELAYRVPNWQDAGRATADVLESLEHRIAAVESLPEPGPAVRHGDAGEVRGRRRK